MPLSVNAGEYKSLIGLDSLYIAQVTADSSSAYTADTPEYFAPAAEASLATASNMETQYADDQPYDVMVSEGETAITLTITGLPAAMYAKVLGKVFDAGTGRVWDNGGTPPDCALSFRTLKSNGSYRYYQFLKGKFTPPSMETATKTDTPDPKTTQIIYTAVKTIYKWNLGSVTDSVLKIMGDDDSTNFSETGWFGAVQTPAYVAPSALALSSSTPTDGATGINVAADITLTFNNAMINGTIYDVVVTKANGDVVACVNSLDATKKILTINPTGSLTGSTVHIVAYAVEDVYGQTLQGAINFTTA